MGYNPVPAETLGMGTPWPVQRDGEIVGIDTYPTSEIRVSDSVAAAERHMALIAPGEPRVERWGLRRLARDIERVFPGLSTRVLG
ncbi:MAG: hypothetical protein HYX51_05750 [Chloroflexi bacterium]|nr:hypothetical protein [Chloroflexota bacterium]